MVAAEGTIVAIGRFKDLILDVGDVEVMASFWGAVLGQKQVSAGGADVLLEAPAEGPKSRAIWLNVVPEERSGKTRVHLDIRLPTDDPSPVVELGARILAEPTDGTPWWVCADPEGNVFCLMPPDPDAPTEARTLFELTVDSADPVALASWWADVSGGKVGDWPDAPCPYVDGVPDFPGAYWVFQPVSEPKTVKNRLHWDVTMDRPEPSALLAAGARLLVEPTAETPWWVLADPEGNEFCAFAPE